MRVIAIICLGATFGFTSTAWGSEQSKQVNSAWSVVSPTARARLFAARAAYCVNEPIDLVLVIQNTSDRRITIPNIELDPLVADRALPADKSFNLVLRWRHHMKWLRKSYPARRKLRKRLKKMPIRIAPGDIYPVAIRLHFHKLLMKQLRKRRVGEPIRLDATLIGHPRRKIRIDATWTPFPPGVGVKLPPVWIEINHRRKRDDPWQHCG